MKITNVLAATAAAAITAFPVVAQELKFANFTSPFSFSMTLSFTV